jgi:hypothetical protein
MLVLGARHLVGCGGMAAPRDATPIAIVPPAAASSTRETEPLAASTLAVSVAREKVCIDALEPRLASLGCVTVRGADYAAFVDANTVMIAHDDGAVTKLDVASKAMTKVDVWSKRPEVSWEHRSHRLWPRSGGLWARNCLLSYGEAGTAPCSDDDPCAPLPGVAGAITAASCKEFESPAWHADPPAAFSFKDRNAGVVDDKRRWVIACAASDAKASGWRDLIHYAFGISNQFSSALGRVGVPGEPTQTILLVDFYLDVAGGRQNLIYLVNKCDHAELIVDVSQSHGERLLVRGPDRYWAHVSDDGEAWTIRRGAQARKKVEGEPAFWPWAR